MNHLLSRAAMLTVFLIFFVAAPLQAANFLWQVEAECGGEAYILGSIHLAQAGLYPLAEPIMESFYKSRQLAVELDVEAMDEAELVAYIRTHGLSGNGRPLKENLSPATLEIFTKSDFDTEPFAGVKPWLAALTLQVNVMRGYGYDEKYGLDRYFLREAKTRGLPIVELETLEEQMGPLAMMTDEESDLFFRATILELSELSHIMEKMFEAWRTGDAKGFAAVFFQEYDKYPELTPILDKVIFRRNDTMAARIEKLLARPGEPYFIVIGAGHLVGPGSVLELLEKTGHSVKQM